MLTGGEDCVEMLTATTTMLEIVQIVKIPERASVPQEKRWLCAVFLASMLYAIMMQPCAMNNTSIATKMVCS